MEKFRDTTGQLQKAVSDPLKLFRDQYNPFRRISREAWGKSEGIGIGRGEQTAYWKARQLSGSGREFELVLDEFSDVLQADRPYGKGMWGRGVLDPKGPEMFQRDLTEFMQAKRIKEMAELGKFRKDLVNEQQLELAETALQELEWRVGSDRMAVLERTAERTSKFLDDKILKVARDGGLLSKKDYALITSEIKNYFPQWLAETSKTTPAEIAKMQESFAKMLDAEPGQGGTTYSGLVQDVIFRMKKPGEPIADPFTTSVGLMAATRRVAAKNKIRQNLINEVKMAGLAEPGKGLFRELFADENANPGEGEFVFLSHGKPHRWAAPEEIVQTLMSGTRADIGFIGKALREHRRFFTMMTTGIYLPFTVSNVFRDAPLAFLTAKHGFGPLSHARGFYHSLLDAFGYKTEFVQKYLKGGGGMSGMIERSRYRGSAKEVFLPQTQKAAVHNLDYRSALGVVKSIVTTPAQTIQRIAQAFENAPRYGVAEKAMRKGATPIEGAMRGRSSTIDFPQQGTILRRMFSWVPFFAANVGAKATQLEAFAKGTGLKYGKASFMGLKGDPRMIAGAKAVAASLPFVGAYLYNRVYHSDAYDNLDERYKENFTLILGEGQPSPETGEPRTKIISIPAPDYVRFLTRIPIAALERVFHKDPDGALRLAVEHFMDISPLDFMQGSDFIPTRSVAQLVPPAVLGPAETAMGYDMYYGRPIVRSEKLRNVEPRLQYDERTPGPYRGMGDALNVSPMRIHHLARKMGGSIFGAPSVGSLAEQTKGRVVREVRANNLDSIYTNTRSLEKAYNSGRLRAERLVKAGKEGEAKVELIKMSNAMDKRIVELEQELGRRLPRLRNRFTMTKLERADFIRDRRTRKPTDEIKKLWGEK